MGQFRLPRIASTDRSSSAWASAELMYDSNLSRLYYGDGASNGGIPLATGTGAFAVSANGASQSVGTVVFSNSNNVSFGMAGSVVTASASFAGAGGVAISAGTLSTGTGTVAFSNANGISFGMETNSVITASHNGLTTQSNQQLSLYATGNTTQSSTGTQNASSILFRGEGNVSVGISNGSVVISGSGGGAADGVNILAAGSQTANTTGSILFQNSNGISFGMSNSSVITASHNGITLQSSPALSGSNGSFTFQTATFGQSNGLTFYTTNGSMVASHNALTSQSNQAFSAGAASSAFQTLSFQDSNGISFSNNAGAIRLTHALQFTSATSAITSAALHTSSPRINVSAGTTSNNLSAVTFANGGGVSFGLNLSTVTASVREDWLSTQSNQAFSAQGGSSAFQTLIFTNSNGFSFSNTGGSIWGSHNGITSQSNQQLSLYATGNTTQSSTGTQNASSLLFNGAGIISVGITNGSVVISASAAGAGDGVNIIAAGTQTAATNGTVVFSNSNGISFGMSNSSIVTANVSQATLSNSNNVSFGVAAGVITATATFAQSNQTLGLYFTSNTTQGSSGTKDARSLTFHGAGIASVGYSNGSVIISVPSGGGGLTNINVSAGTTSNNLSALTFSNANGVSFGLNGSVVTASVEPQRTLSHFEPYANRLIVAGQAGQATLAINPMPLQQDLSFDRVGYAMYFSNAANSSGSHTVSFWGGLYTKNVSTLSLITSWSGQTVMTQSGTAGSYSLWSGGPRLFTIGVSTSLPASNYWLGVISRTTSGGANATFSQFLVSAMASNFLGHFGSAHNTTMQFGLGRGVYTATTSAMPNAIPFTDIRGSDSLAQRPPVVIFANGTV